MVKDFTAGIFSTCGRMIHKRKHNRLKKANDNVVLGSVSKCGRRDTVAKIVIMLELYC